MDYMNCKLYTLENGYKFFRDYGISFLPIKKGSGECIQLNDRYGRFGYVTIEQDLCSFPNYKYFFYKNKSKPSTAVTTVRDTADNRVTVPVYRHEEDKYSYTKEQLYLDRNGEIFIRYWLSDIDCLEDCEFIFTQSFEITYDVARSLLNEDYSAQEQALINNFIFKFNNKLL